MESGDGQVMQLPVTEGGINEETAPGEVEQSDGKWRVGGGGRGRGRVVRIITVC